jgi:hypothetical protein
MPQQDLLLRSSLFEIFEAGCKIISESIWRQTVSHHGQEATQKYCSHQHSANEKTKAAQTLCERDGKIVHQLKRSYTACGTSPTATAGSCRGATDTKM